MTNMIFDFTNLTITAADFDDIAAEKDIYSTWKRLMLTGPSALNVGAPPAFSTSVGGNDIGGGQEISPYFFVRNDLGWRIRPPSGDGELNITGNLFPADTTLTAFESNPLSNDTVLIRSVVSPQSITDASAVADLALLKQFQLNKLHTDPITGKIELYSNDGLTVILEGFLFEDIAGTIPYRGRGAERRDKMVAP